MSFSEEIYEAYHNLETIPAYLYESVFECGVEDAFIAEPGYPDSFIRLGGIDFRLIGQLISKRTSKVLRNRDLCIDRPGQVYANVVLCSVESGLRYGKESRPTVTLGLGRYNIELVQPIEADPDDIPGDVPVYEVCLRRIPGF